MNQKIVIFWLPSGFVCSFDKVVQGQSVGRAFERPHNIILITADDLGHKTIHCYSQLLCALSRDCLEGRSVVNKKLTLYETGEIYDIASDPDEQNSLSEESHCPLCKK